MATVAETPARTVGPDLRAAVDATGPRHLSLADNGRRMSLRDFEDSTSTPGHLYELGRGVVVVTEVAELPIGRIAGRVGDVFLFYEEAHPGRIDYRASRGYCRIRLPGMASDRQPCLALYLSPPPDEGPRIWTRWVPDLVVEIVSEGGEERDYVEKREEYLRAGVREYWILNPHTRVLHALQRAGDVWQEETVVADGLYRCPLLPGLEVRPADLFGPAATS